MRNDPKLMAEIREYARDILHRKIDKALEEVQTFYPGDGLELKLTVSMNDEAILWLARKAGAELPKWEIPQFVTSPNDFPRVEFEVRKRGFFARLFGS